MNLHYSQTKLCNGEIPIRFYYLMNLHYSQTYVPVSAQYEVFYYLMNLHYSQTPDNLLHMQAIVLLPYEFTLFSNYVWQFGYGDTGFTTL